MGNTLTARELLHRTALLWRRDPADVERLLSDVPMDFPVTIDDRLPFGVERHGMSGITLRGRVYIHQAVLEQSPLSILLLLRHEAEHVRQQRNSPYWFYVRYVGEWIVAVIRLLGSARNRVSRSRRAYLMISAEREAYGAEGRARAMLEEMEPTEVGQIVQGDR